MNQIVRFWILIVTFTIGFGAFGYLFVSFWEPDAYLVTTGTEVRLAATAIALVGIGLFTWAAVFAGSSEPGTIASQSSDGKPPEL